MRLSSGGKRARTEQDVRLARRPDNRAAPAPRRPDGPRLGHYAHVRQAPRSASRAVAPSFHPSWAMRTVRLGANRASPTDDGAGPPSADRRHPSTEPAVSQRREPCPGSWTNRSSPLSYSPAEGDVRGPPCHDTVHMADLEITRSESLTREDAAKLLMSMAEALASGGTHMQLQIGDSQLKLRVPEQVRAEIELEVDDGEVELECELVWSLPHSHSGSRKQSSKASSSSD